MTLTHSSSSLVISIPVLLLRQVRISLRRKILLGAILSLSIFMIVTSIIRISAGNIIDGQIDTTWAIFWLQAEAAIAVMVVSVSAFRALFVVDGSKSRNVPQQSPSWRRWLRSRSRTANDGLPSVPSPTTTGVRTLIGRISHNRNQSAESEGVGLQSFIPGIRVTHEITTDGVRDSPYYLEDRADSYSTIQLESINRPTSPLSETTRRHIL